MSSAAGLMPAGPRSVPSLAPPPMATTATFGTAPYGVGWLALSPHGAELLGASGEVKAYA